MYRQRSFQVGGWPLASIALQLDLMPGILWSTSSYFLQNRVTCSSVIYCTVFAPDFFTFCPHCQSTNVTIVPSATTPTVGLNRIDNFRVLVYVRVCVWGRKGGGREGVWSHITLYCKVRGHRVGWLAPVLAWIFLSCIGFSNPNARQLSPKAFVNDFLQI